jgi:hypothetical protein
VVEDCWTVVIGDFKQWGNDSGSGHQLRCMRIWSRKVAGYGHVKWNAEDLYSQERR